MGNVYNLESYEFCDTALFDMRRFDRPDLGLSVVPSFRIEPSDRVFTIGSCFAQEIRSALDKRGFDVTDADLGNRYNTFSTLHAVEWALDGGYGPHLVIEAEDGRWFDGHAYPLEYHETAEQAVEVHQRALDKARLAIGSCNVIVLTLGLVEVWRDNRTQTWWNMTPPRGLLACNAGRLSVVRTTHADNLRALLAILRRLRTANPKARINVTCDSTPTDKTQNMAHMRFTLDIPDVDTLSRVLALIDRVPNVTEVRRRVQ